MSHNLSSKTWLRLSQNHGFWARAASLLAVCLAVSGVLAGSPGQAESTSLRAAMVDIAVVPSSVSVYVNEIFTLEIWVYPNGQPVDVVDADVTFDPTCLEVLSITGDPSALPDELYSAFDNAVGSLTHSQGILVGAPPSSTFRLCSIELRARATTYGMTLAFTDLTGSYFEGDPVLRDTIGSTVIIPIPVGGEAGLPDPGRILTRSVVRRAAIAGLMLGAVVVFHFGRPKRTSGGA
jgi:hypothetical protein